MELREATLVLIRGIKAIGATLGVSLLIGILVATFQTPSYRATATIFVDVTLPGVTNTETLEAASTLSIDRTITFKPLVRTEFILDPVIDKLGLHTSASELASDVTALSALDTAIIDIIVERPDPQQAADIANEIASVMISALDETSTDGTSSLALKQVQTAAAPSVATTPNIPLLLGLCGFAGLLLGIGMVYIRDSFSPRVHSADQLARLSEAPILAVVKRRIRSHQDPSPLRGASAVLITRGDQGGPHALAIVSPKVQDGKSHISQLLAEAMAQGGADVGLIDVNERNSSDTDQDAQPPKNSDIVAAQNHDFIVMDTASRLSRRELVDDFGSIEAAIVVVAAGRDSLAEVSTALAYLDALNIPVAGLVLNGVPRATRKAAELVSPQHSDR